MKLSRRAALLPLLAALLFCLLAGTVCAKQQPTLNIRGDHPAGVTANLRALIGIQRYACRPDSAQKTLILRQVHNNAIEALQALGYFQPTFTRHWQAADDDHCFSLALDFETGPATRIRKLDIELQGDAHDDPAFRRLIAASGLEVGDRLRQDRYEDLKQGLQQVLINRGYAEGQLTAHRLEVDPEHRSATVVLHVASGPRYQFGTTTLAGNPQLDDDLLRGYLQFASGQPFSNEKLLATQQAYLGSGYFSAVQLQRGKPDQQDHRIDVTIHFSPRNRWSLLTGVGISTDTGPRLRLGVENRRLNRHGHSARAETELSGLRQGVGARYQIPLRDPINEKLSLHTRYLNEETTTSDSESLSVGADYIIQTASGWVLTPSIEYLKETYKVAHEQDRANLVIPGFQLTRVQADDRVHPNFGWKLGVKIRGATETVLSSATFIQYDAWGKLIVPVPGIGGRLITRAEVGLTQVSDVRELPASLRFFAGGDTSVRGFAYQALGPKNSKGDVIGGRDLLVASAEYDHPLTDNWSLAVFTDAGNAFNTFNDYHIVRSAGFGVRWHSPLGPIRIDLARGLEAGQSWRVHLSMGPDL